MFNRKNIFAKLLFAILLCFGSQANAGILDWHATVRYSNGQKVDIAAPTQQQCQLQRNFAISNPPFRTTVQSATPCTPLLAKMLLLERFKLIWWPSPFPWPEPWPCLSCPPFVDFNDKLIKEIYPEQFERVTLLKDKFRMDEYQDELLNLQKEFDLEGFQNELLEIEMEGISAMSDLSSVENIGKRVGKFNPRDLLKR